MKKRRERLTIGNEIKVIMEKESVSGYRLSKETGINETYISRIIHNRTNPSYLTLKRILDVMGYQICFERKSERKEMKKAKPTSLISKKGR